MQNDDEYYEDAVTYSGVGSVVSLNDRAATVPKREFPPGFDLRPAKRKPLSASAKTWRKVYAGSTAKQREKKR